jgi:hypothetical protein
MTELEQLIADLETATGPDRALDERIALALGWTCHRGYGNKAALDLWTLPAGLSKCATNFPPAFTGSYDAARSTVPRNLLRLCFDWQSTRKWMATLKVGGPVQETAAVAATEILAMLAASMRLRLPS